MEATRETVPISALEHWSYCPRQCGLIHIEQTFTDNIHTIRGHQAHEHVHAEGAEERPGIRTVRGLTLWSESLGLVGKADVVEFYEDRPYPVEHKVGKRRRWGHEDIQLAAQAMCLEEMLVVAVPAGAISYRGSQRRREVEISTQLRDMVRQSAEAVRHALASGILPSAVNDERCPECSLFDVCLPDLVSHPRKITLFKTELFKAEEWD